MVLRLIVLLSLCAPGLQAGPEFDDAVALYRAKSYPAAREAFTKITAAEPTNAAACHYLGLILLRRGDRTALDDAITSLEKAVKLEPGNATYLADFGGASLQLANRNHSYGAATRGRDALEKSLQLDPENLDAHEGLMQFYDRAPWPLGSSAKAAAQLEEIRRGDPDRATALSVTAKANAKDYASAFKICDALLAQKPDDYMALYQYGRTASLAGENLARGLACLQKCLTLSPPGHASPQPTHAWYHIGLIQEKLAHPTEARVAYETAVKLDATNKPAADALGKLR